MFVGAVIDVAFVTICLPSSKSFSSSKRIPCGSDSELSSNLIPSFTVLDGWPFVLTTFSNVVLKTCVSES